MLTSNGFDYRRFIEPLVRATDALARYDQMLKSMHNSEILLAPLRNQEAVISSRMEGTVSTMDEILKYEADYGAEAADAPNVRSEVIEYFLLGVALQNRRENKCTIRRDENSIFRYSVI
jgi:hypothetical protein